MSIIVAAVGDGRPVVDIGPPGGTRRRRLVPPFYAEFEPRDTVRRTDCLDLSTSHRNFEPV